MKRYNIDGGIPTLAVALAVALAEHMNADALKKLASLTSGPVPTRKAELAALIVKHLEGTRLRSVDASRQFDARILGRRRHRVA